MEFISDFEILDFINHLGKHEDSVNRNSRFSMFLRTNTLPWKQRLFYFSESKLFAKRSHLHKSNLSPKAAVDLRERRGDFYHVRQKIYGDCNNSGWSSSTNSRVTLEDYRLLRQLYKRKMIYRVSWSQLNLFPFILENWCILFLDLGLLKLDRERTLAHVHFIQCLACSLSPLFCFLILFAQSSLFIPCSRH